MRAEGHEILGLRRIGGGRAVGVDRSAGGQLLALAEELTGETGSGKTLGGVNAMLWEVTKNCPNWGGVCVDDKGLYADTLATMLARVGRLEDLVVLEVRPETAPLDWKPPHTFNFLADPYLPFSGKAKIVCDVAAAQGQRSDQTFFRAQAQVQMEFAFRLLAASDIAVTLETAYDLLGRITLATGKTLDLTGFFIVFTSNIGSREVMGMASPPFSSVKRTVLMRASQQLRPELYNRITEKVVFARLDFATQREICERMIALECERLGSLGHRLDLAPAAVEFLLRDGYHKTLGARPLRGAIERYLQDAIAAALLSGRSTCGRLDVSATRDRLEIIQANNA